jgi:hypothetical protein
MAAKSGSWTMADDRSSGAKPRDPDDLRTRIAAAIG